MYFCKMRSMLGMNEALSVELFCQNSRSILLRDISPLSKNNDGTFSRTQYKSFFNDLNEVIKLQEKGIANDLKVKLSNLNNFSKIDQSYIYQNEILLYISGYCVKKLVKNNLKGYEKYYTLFTYGKNISEDEKFMLEYNTKFMNIRNKGGLM